MALSKRIAIEFKRTERERREHAQRLEVIEEQCCNGHARRLESVEEPCRSKLVNSEHVRRLEALEELCRTSLGGLTDRVGRAQEAAAAEVELIVQRAQEQLKQDFGQRLSKALQRFSQEMQSTQEHCAEALEELTARSDADRRELEEFRAWQREVQAWRAKTEARLVAASDSTERGRNRTDEDELGSLLQHLDTRAERRLKSSGGELDMAVIGRRLQELCGERWEAVLKLERQAANDRLAAGCKELTTHLNHLREEVLEQRTAGDRCSEELRAWRREAQRSLAARDSWLEAQVSELGAALAVQLEEKLDALAGSFSSRASRSGGAGGLDLLRDQLRREAGLLAEGARDEARFVHTEVMALNARVASIEARLLQNSGLGSARIESMRA